MRALVALALLALAWNADVEALPVAGDNQQLAAGNAAPDTDVARVDPQTTVNKDAPQTAGTVMAAAKVDAGKANIQALLAKYAASSKPAQPSAGGAIDLSGLPKFNADS